VSAPAGDLLRWVEIDVDTLASNAATVAALVGPAEVMAMVKSNGYGHGMSIAARAALDGGAAWLGVYLPQEALALRSAGFVAPILVVGWSPATMLEQLVAANVDVSVFDADGIHSLAAAATATGGRARAHLKIDTGLRRLGALPESVDSIVKALRGVEGRIELVGVFTHFADAGGDFDFTIAQHGRFLDAVEAVRTVAPHPLLHTSGSAAIFAHPDMHHDLVRLGIAFYGYPPVPAPVSLPIAMHVFSRVAQVRAVHPGDTVGYGRTWRAESPRRIATVAMGYGQGLPRALSNRGDLAIRGRRCPIVGVVSMDQVTVDITDGDSIVAGDAAMFIGERDGVRIGADEVGDLTGTLPHEVLCGIAEGIERLPGAATAALP
jgi:alanine racemase